jgi:hypothetical protein
VCVKRCQNIFYWVKKKNTAQENTVQQNTGNEKQEKANKTVDTNHSGEFKEQEKIALPEDTISIEMTSLKNNTTNQTSSSTHPVLTSSTATTLNNHFEDSEHLRSTSTDTISTSVRSGLSFYKGTPYIRRDSRSGKYFKRRERASRNGSTVVIVIVIFIS